jgi:hypothetical protein
LSRPRPYNAVAESRFITQNASKQKAQKAQKRKAQKRNTAPASCFIDIKGLKLYSGMTYALLRAFREIPTKPRLKRAFVMKSDAFTNYAVKISCGKSTTLTRTY